MITLQSCAVCGALVEQTSMSMHQTFHNNLPSTFPCEECGGAVSLYSHHAHLAYHQRVRAMEELVQRLVGDVEAHLEYLSK